MKSSASKGRNRCHTPASVHGICFMPFEADLFMASINLSILYGKGGNKIFTILISSFASNCKNRKQIQANSSKYMIARTILPEDDDGRDGVTGSGSWPLAATGLWILSARRRAQLWILTAGGGGPLALAWATACPALDLDC